MINVFLAPPRKTLLPAGGATIRIFLPAGGATIRIFDKLEENRRAGVLLPLPVQNMKSNHVLSNVKEHSFRFSISNQFQIDTRGHGRL
jgi:hypothetical protein